MRNRCLYMVALQTELWRRGVLGWGVVLVSEQTWRVSTRLPTRHAFCVFPGRDSRDECYVDRDSIAIARNATSVFLVTYRRG